MREDIKGAAKSKTIRFNGLLAILWPVAIAAGTTYLNSHGIPITESDIGVIASWVVGAGVPIFSVINIVLRWITRKPLALKGDKDLEKFLILLAKNKIAGKELLDGAEDLQEIHPE